MTSAQNGVVYSKKICMLGTFGVGKSSLVKRFVHGIFDDTYLSTIGVQIYEKHLGPFPGACSNELNLVIWDLANIEKLTSATKTYFGGAAAAIVVFDLTRHQTFDEKRIYLQAFRDKNPRATYIFATNKSDLFATHEVPAPLTALAKSYAAPCVRTSAKTGENVARIFQMLGESLLT